MRPAISPANIRRNQTAAKIRQTIARGMFWTLAYFATVALFVLIASIDTLI